MNFIYFFFWGVGAYSRLGALKSTFWGWVLIRGWAFINFFYLQGGRLFEVGADSRLGTYSNKYGTYVHTPIQRQEFKEGNLH